MLVFMSVLARAVKSKGKFDQDGAEAEDPEELQKRSDDQTIFEVLCRLQEKEEYKYFRETEISNLMVQPFLPFFDPVANS